MDSLDYTDLASFTQAQWEQLDLKKYVATNLSKFLVSETSKQLLLKDSDIAEAFFLRLLETGLSFLVETHEQNIEISVAERDSALLAALEKVVLRVESELAVSHTEEIAKKAYGNYSLDVPLASSEIVVDSEWLLNKKLNS